MDNLFDLIKEARLAHFSGGPEKREVTEEPDTPETTGDIETNEDFNPAERAESLKEKSKTEVEAETEKHTGAAERTKDMIENNELVSRMSALDARLQKAMEAAAKMDPLWAEMEFKVGVHDNSPALSVKTYGVPEQTEAYWKERMPDSNVTTEDGRLYFHHTEEEIERMVSRFEAKMMVGPPEETEEQKAEFEKENDVETVDSLDDTEGEKPEIYRHLQSRLEANIAKVHPEFKKTVWGRATCNGEFRKNSDGEIFFYVPAEFAADFRQYYKNDLAGSLGGGLQKDAEGNYALMMTEAAATELVTDIALFTPGGYDEEVDYSAVDGNEGDPEEQAAAKRARKLAGGSVEVPPTEDEEGAEGAPEKEPTNIAKPREAEDIMDYLNKRVAQTPGQKRYQLQENGQVKIDPIGPNKEAIINTLKDVGVTVIDDGGETVTFSPTKQWWNMTIELNYEHSYPDRPDNGRPKLWVVGADGFFEPEYGPPLLQGGAPDEE